MRLEIHYCPKCGWLMRSAWLAQELLSTFENELSEVALCPHPQAGTFVIRVGDQQVWERKTDGGFPQPKEIKQRVRDVVSPQRDLGHSDR